MQAKGLSIKTKKIVYRGDMMYKVLEFSCYNIEDDEIPHKYFEKYPFCFETDGSLMICTNDGSIELDRINLDHPNSYQISVGDYIDKDNFEKIVKILRVCGEKLHNINQEIKEMKKEWNGEEEFKI